MRLPSSAVAAAVLLIVGAVIAGCESDGKPQDAPSGSPVTTLPPGVVDTTSTRITPLDPRTGSLGATAVGAVKGAWRFDDVNGTRIESARGGASVTTLQIEAHQVPPDVHLRLHLSLEDELSEGRYVIGAPSGRMLDAHFEYQGQTYRAIGQARGSVELNRITVDRAVGTYEVTLESLTGKKRSLVTVSGAFDLRVQ